MERVDTRPTPERLKEMRKQLDWTQAQAAHMVDVSERQWRKYETGVFKIPHVRWVVFSLLWDQFGCQKRTDTT